MRVLVTGAAGRVGTNVVKRLINEGAHVRAMVLPGDPQRVKLARFNDVEIIDADLSDQAAVNDACAGVTHVVHLAAQLVRGSTPVDRFYDVNALGTLRLLEGVVRRARPIERFVLASSDGTYRPGAPPTVPLTESTPQEPADYYGTSKLLGEVILRNHSKQFDIPFAIVRFATVVSPEEASGVFRLSFWRNVLRWQTLGKDSHLWHLFENQPNLTTIFDRQVKDAPRDTAVGLMGPDRSPWTLSLLDVRDAVEGTYQALVQPAAIGREFNLAAAAPTRHDDGASVISDIFGVPKILVSMPLTHRLELSISHAQQYLNYSPKFGYEQMVRTGLSNDRCIDYVPARSNSGVAATLYS